MRYLVPVLALVLVACSSQTGSCSNDPPGSACDSFPVDVVPFDTSSDDPRDVGPDVVFARDVIVDAAPRDVAVVDEKPVDVAPLDVAPDAATDVAVVVDAATDTSSDAPEVSAPRDVAVVDVPPGECAAVERSCRVNADCAMCTPVRGLTWCCGVIGGRSTCAVPLGDGSCPGVVRDAGPVAPDVRVNCDERLYRCTRHEDCWSMCADNPVISQWCCGASGVCGVTSSGSCMR